MTRNKILFIILWVICCIAILIFALGLNSPNRNTVGGGISGDFNIWILNDDSGVFGTYIDTFLEENPAYRNLTINVESFSDRGIYQDSLTSAITGGVWPDMFVINNRESSSFENQILGIDPSIISPNDFRLRFSPVFSEDLIESDGVDLTLEFLKGVPLWYEALGVYYSRKYFLKPSELSTWTDFAAEVKNISEKYASIVPLAIGNGSWVTRADDIITALFVLGWWANLMETGSNISRSAFWLYSSYSDTDGDNGYGSLSASFVANKDIEFFTEWDTAAMIGFPRDLETISEIWYQKSFLFATPFPGYAGEDKKTSISYDYFVINKDSDKTNMAYDMLSYMASTQGQQNYINSFPYYLSPELNVADEMMEKKIVSGYNIVYKNFIDEWAELVSYGVGNLRDYEKEIVRILDQELWQNEEFSNFSSKSICGTTKYSTLLNLSSPCK